MTTIVAATTPARAGDLPREEVVPVASRAFEVAFAAGYEQGLGDFAAGRPIADVASAGGGARIAAAYRVSAPFALGVYASGAPFELGDRAVRFTDVYAATAGVEATWHFAPERVVDPWASLGMGWRAVWISVPSGSTAMNGIDLAKAQFGFDVRISPTLAFGPAVGADATVFASEPHARVSAVVFSVLQLRIALGRAGRGG